MIVPHKTPLILTDLHAKMEGESLVKSLIADAIVLLAFQERTAELKAMAAAAAVAVAAVAVAAVAVVVVFK
jgi:hypothetical protein